MSTVQIQTGSTYNLAHFHYYATDIANADGTLLVTADTAEAVAPFAGSIIGMGLHVNGTFTTGTLTPQPTINGSLCPAFGGTLTISQRTLAVQQSAKKANYTFNAGDRIGLIWNKAGTIAPTTRDAVATLVVLYQEVRY
jgi:hypothetical protein